MAFILFILLIISSKQKSTEILVLEFKTYYPLTYNMTQNNKEYNPQDFISSYLFSKLYFELKTGNDVNVQNEINQTLNTIINHKTDSFILRNMNKYNISFCNYNSSLSNTFKLNMQSPSYCKSSEIFKIYTDLSLSENINANFSLDNYNCLNYSICGEVGTDISTYKNNKDFISKLKNILNGKFQNFAFHYLENKDEGLFIFGDMPHNYLKNKFKENELISFYSNDYNFEIIFDSISFNGKEYYSEENENINNYEHLNIAISPDTEGIEFDKFFFDILIKLFFNKYIEKNICKVNKDDFITTIIYCYGDKFSKEDINKFPKIIFSKYKFNFNISFDNEELFYYKDNKYFCKIYSKLGQYKKFVLGRILLKNYLPIFNAGERRIYFYNKELDIKNKKNFLEKNQKLILILFIIGLIIFLILGILIGKIIFTQRKKHANELDDKYEYQSNKKNGVEPLYNSKEEEKEDDK